MNDYAIFALLLLVAVAMVVLIYRPKNPKKNLTSKPLGLKVPEELTALLSDYATEDEQKATFKALTRLSHIGVQSDGSLIDWRTGATIASCPADEAFPLHITIRYSGARRICIISRRGLSQFHAIQIAISAQFLQGGN